MDFFFDPTRLGLWIVLGVLVCAVILLGNYGRFRLERKWLTRLKEHLPQNVQNLQEFWSSLSSGTILPTSSITFQRVDVVRHLEQSWIQVDANTLSNIAVAREDSRRVNAIPNFLVSIFLIVGVGGTFLALKDLLHNSPLRDVTASGQIDPKRLQFAIDQIYQGFGAAFYTSIAGIAATVVLLALRIVWVIPEREKFFSELDELTQLQLIPLFRLRDNESTVYAHASQISENLAEAAVRADNVAKELNKYSKSVGATADHLKSFVSKLHQTVDEVGEIFGSESDMQNAIYELVKFTANADRRHEDLSTNIAEALTKSAAQNEAVNRLCDSSREHMERLLEAHGQWLKSAEKAEDQFVAALSTHNAELEGILSRNEEASTRALDSLSAAIRSIPTPISPSDVTAAVSEAIGPLSKRFDQYVSQRQPNQPDASARAAAASGSSPPRVDHFQATRIETRAAAPVLPSEFGNTDDQHARSDSGLHPSVGQTPAPSAVRSAGAPLTLTRWERALARAKKLLHLRS